MYLQHSALFTSRCIFCVSIGLLSSTRTSDSHFTNPHSFFPQCQPLEVPCMENFGCGHAQDLATQTKSMTLIHWCGNLMTVLLKKLFMSSL
ncbi:hypothetical protein DFH28DRAFT_460189 [Melampsora americana]|nr:hypothetical protein DFH28DRAFT_460189 [Melampsora americana]